MAEAPGRPRISLVLLVLVLTALAVGAAASLVAGAASAAPLSPHTFSELYLPAWAVEAGFLTILVVGICLLLYNRLTSPTVGVPGRLVVTALVTILLAIVLLLIMEAVAGPGGLLGPGGGGSGGNGTGSMNNPPPTQPNGTLPPSSGQFVIFGLHIPSWLPFVLIAAVAVAVCVAVSYSVWGKVAAHRSRAPDRRLTARDVAEVRSALSAAASELGEGGEPRTVVIGLYGALLVRVARIVVGLEGETPEEIRAQHLLRLGIRAGAAESLTRLFEEARYSSHPMGADAATRAREAIAEAIADLDRVPTPVADARP
jgi:hypothetical protein